MFYLYKPRGEETGREDGQPKRKIFMSEENKKNLKKKGGNPGVLTVVEGGAKEPAKTGDAALAEVRALIAERSAALSKPLKYADLPLSYEEIAKLSLTAQKTLARELPFHQRFQLIEKSVYGRQIIRSLPPHELLYMSREIGESDGFALFAAARPEQIQGALDFDAWNRDELSADKVIDWLDKLTTIDPEGMAEKINKLDWTNVLVALLKKIKVVRKQWFEEREDLDPDNYYSIDDYFSFQWLDSSADNEPTWRLLSYLYKRDFDFYMKLMEAAIFELPTENEELCLKEREGRMSELGFPDFDFSLEAVAREKLENVLGKIKRGKFPKDDALIEEGVDALPAVYRAAEKGDSMFGAAVKAMPAHWSAAVRTELVYLCNRIIIARRFESSFELAREGAEWASDCVNLGLEYLSGESLEQAEYILRTTALIGIFRVGHNLAMELRDRARALAKKYAEGGSAAQTPLLNRARRELLSGLVNDYPLFFDEAKPEGEEDAAKGRKAFRAFRRMDDVRACEAELDAVEAQFKFVFETMKATRETFANFRRQGIYPFEPRETTFAHVINTGAALKIIEDRFYLRGLYKKDLRALAAKIAPDGIIDESLEGDFGKWIESETQSWEPRLRSALYAEAKAAFKEFLSELERALKNVPPNFSLIRTAFVASTT